MFTGVDGGYCGNISTLLFSDQSYNIGIISHINDSKRLMFDIGIIPYIIWRFPKMGVPPNHHPFRTMGLSTPSKSVMGDQNHPCPWDDHEKNHPAGYPDLFGNPRAIGKNPSVLPHMTRRTKPEESLTKQGAISQVDMTEALTLISCEMWIPLGRPSVRCFNLKSVHPGTLSQK